MKSALRITTKSAGFNSSNPMALKMREALGQAYGFEPSADPFEFQRQMIEAKANAIAAELKEKEKLRKAEARKAARAAQKAETLARKERQAEEAKEAEMIRKRLSGVRIIAGSPAPVPAPKRTMESTAEIVQRLDEIVQRAEEREMRRQFGKYNRRRIEAETAESDYAAIRREHQTQPGRQKQADIEREQLIDELQRLNAFAGEFMLAYDVYELRRALRRAKKLRGIAEHNASAAPGGEANKPIRFDGYSVGEDERERVVFTIRRMRAQLPRNWDSCSLYELLNHLRNICTSQGRKWFAELWPTCQPTPVVLPTVVKTEIVPEPKAELVDASVERLWTALFGGLGAGY